MQQITATVETLREKAQRAFDKANREKKSTGESTKSESDSKPKEICPTCNGGGWVIYNVAQTDPSFGQAFPCKKCYKPDPSGFTFNRFKQRDVSSKRAYEACQRYVKREFDWMVLTGGVGSGKTHLARATSRTLYLKGVPTHFEEVPVLLERLRASYETKSHQQQVTELMSTKAHVFIDDLGAEKPTEWGVEQLFLIINGRWSGNLPTFITTNLTQAEMAEQISERVASRVFDKSHTIVGMTSGDYRSGS